MEVQFSRTTTVVLWILQVLAAVLHSPQTAIGPVVLLLIVSAVIWLRRKRLTALFA